MPTIRSNMAAPLEAAPDNPVAFDSIGGRADSRGQVIPIPAGFCGGIDLGGTKIESALFGDGLSLAAHRRRPTPQSSYEDVIKALSEEAVWLREEAGVPDLPVGIGVPGMIDPQSGRVLTPNLPASDRSLADDIREQAGEGISVGNDGRCFALSEAHGGAGEGNSTVLGLVLGTGLGGGVCVNGQIMPGPNTLAGEVGHSPLPAELLRRYSLPILKCGCGREGCYETYLCGPGLERLYSAMKGSALSAQEISLCGTDGTRAVMGVWYKIAGELLRTLQLHSDPGCIVIGGGLSGLANIDSRFAEELELSAHSDLRKPVIRKAAFAYSGARGAAILSVQQKRVSDTA